MTFALPPNSTGTASNLISIAQEIFADQLLTSVLPPNRTGIDEARRWKKNLKETSNRKMSMKKLNKDLIRNFREMLAFG